MRTIPKELTYEQKQWLLDNNYYECNPVSDNLIPHEWEIDDWIWWVDKYGEWYDEELYGMDMVRNEHDY